MKVTVELSKDDLKDILEEYFDDKGWDNIEVISENDVKILVAINNIKPENFIN